MPVKKIFEFLILLLKYSTINISVTLWKKENILYAG